MKQVFVSILSKNFTRRSMYCLILMPFPNYLGHNVDSGLGEPGITNINFRNRSRPQLKRGVSPDIFLVAQAHNHLEGR